MRGLSWSTAPEKIQLALQAFVIELTKASLGGCLLIWISPEADFFLIRIARRKKKIASTENYPYRFKKPNPQSCHNFGWFANVHDSFFAFFCLATFQKKWATFLPFFLYLNWIKIPVVPIGILPFISIVWVLGLFFCNNQFLHYFFKSFPLFLPNFLFLLLSRSPIILLYFVFYMLYFICCYFLFPCVLCVRSWFRRVFMVLKRAQTFAIVPKATWIGTRLQIFFPYKWNPVTKS